MPEMPSACVRCGTRYGLTRQPFAIRSGGRTDSVDLLFCPACWRRRLTARHVSRIAVVVVLIASLGGAALAVATSSLSPAVVGSAIAALVVAAAYLNWRSAAPRLAQLPDGSTGIDVPGHGPVRVAVGDGDN